MPSLSAFLRVLNSRTKQAKFKKTVEEASDVIDMQIISKQPEQPKTFIDWMRKSEGHKMAVYCWTSKSRFMSYIVKCKKAKVERITKTEYDRLIACCEQIKLEGKERAI